MNNYCVENEEHLKLFNTIVKRETLEDRALASLTSETLKKLNVSIDGLPRKCRTLLERVSDQQISLQLQALDPVAISLHKSREIFEKLEDDYVLLELKQKNIELQAKIDRNNRFLTKLRKDLDSSRQNLSLQNPNPDNIDDILRQWKQKLTTYEDNYELAKRKYSNLNVPESILPKSFKSQLTTLHALSDEAVSLRTRADEVVFMRETIAKLNRLRR